MANEPNRWMKWTGHEVFYDADEVRNLSIAAKPGEIIEASPACAKRLLKADSKWVEQVRRSEEVETKRGWRTVTTFEDKAHEKPAEKVA